MLAKYFKHVNAIELDKTNFTVLSNNIDVYGYKNINLINGDSTVELNKLNQDVIYIDAPWGGRDYKKFKQLRLFLGKMELSDIYNKFNNRTKLFIFKVPYNYDINNFLLRTKVKNLRIYSYQQHDRVKFLFLMIRIVK
jgi:16S rRNA G966 N2-methylase RsmD